MRAFVRFPLRSTDELIKTSARFFPAPSSFPSRPRRGSPTAGWGRRARRSRRRHPRHPHRPPPWRPWRPSPGPIRPGRTYRRGRARPGVSGPRRLRRSNNNRAQPSSGLSRRRGSVATMRSRTMSKPRHRRRATTHRRRRARRPLRRRPMRTRPRRTPRIRCAQSSRPPSRDSKPCARTSTTISRSSRTGTRSWRRRMRRSRRSSAPSRSATSQPPNSTRASSQ